jgi:hypothetical protein
MAGSSFEVDLNNIHGLQNLAGTGAGLASTAPAQAMTPPKPAPSLPGISGP